MRSLAPALAVVALGALAGSAAASDSMLPVLLEERTGPAGGAVEAPEPEAQGARTAPAGATPAPMGAALLGAVLVVAGTFLLLARLDRAGERRP